MSDNFRPIDLLGDEDDDLTSEVVQTGPPKRGPGRPRNADRPEKRIVEMFPGGSVNGKYENARREQETGITLDAVEVMAGVSVQWLATVFNSSTLTISKKLVGCPVFRTVGNTRFYLLNQAASYIAKPRFDGNGNAALTLANITEKDLPDELRKDYWDAKNKSLAYHLKAGDLWLTADVQELFGYMATKIKDVFLQAPDTLELLVPEVKPKRKQVAALFDSILGDIHKKLVTMVAERRTGSAAGRDVQAKPSDV